MTTTRTYTETLQVREYAVNSNGIGKDWKTRVEKKYQFENVSEFLKLFKPANLSEGLRLAIEKAFLECGQVTFNLGSGNKTFNFKAL